MRKPPLHKLHLFFFDSSSFPCIPTQFLLWNPSNCHFLFFVGRIIEQGEICIVHQRAPLPNCSNPRTSIFPTCHLSPTEVSIKPRYSISCHCNFLEECLPSVVQNIFPVHSPFYSYVIYTSRPSPPNPSRQWQAWCTSLVIMVVGSGIFGQKKGGGASIRPDYKDWEGITRSDRSSDGNAMAREARLAHLDAAIEEHEPKTTISMAVRVRKFQQLVVWWYSISSESTSHINSPNNSSESQSSPRSHRRF